MSLPTFRELWRAVSNTLAAPPPPDPALQLLEAVARRTDAIKNQIDAEVAETITHMREIASLNDQTEWVMDPYYGTNYRNGAGQRR